MTTKTKLKYSGGFLIVSAFSLLWVFISFIGIPIFMDKFEVTNKTKQTIYVTPFGQWEGSQQLGTLPIYAIPYPSVISPIVTDLKIKRNDTKEIWFDSDDIWLRGFLVKTDNEPYKVMAAKLEYPKFNFAITDTTQLTIADSSLLHITNDTHYLRLTILHLVILAGLLNLILFVRLLIMRIKERRMALSKN
jgi:hypothetical protein